MKVYSLRIAPSKVGIATSVVNATIIKTLSGLKKTIRPIWKAVERLRKNIKIKISNKNCYGKKNERI